MKKLSLLILLLVSYSGKSEEIISKILPSITLIESGGKSNAIGDRGKAKGILQIWKITVDDVNRIYKTNYKHNDCFNPRVSEEIFRKYLTFWGKQYTKRTGKKVTPEILARIWNGGPFGYRKKATLHYVRKFSIQYKKLQSVQPKEDSIKSPVIILDKEFIDKKLFKWIDIHSIKITPPAAKNVNVKLIFRREDLLFLIKTN